MNALNPRHLSPTERRRELCAILALGLVRLRHAKSTEVFGKIEESSLHSGRHQSGHATTSKRRTA